MTYAQLSFSCCCTRVPVSPQPSTIACSPLLCLGFAFTESVLPLPLEFLTGQVTNESGQNISCAAVVCPCHRVLAEAVLSFPLALTEVTLGIGRGRRVMLRSYQEEEAGEGIRPVPRGNRSQE